MNSFDRFSRDYCPPSESPFRSDALRPRVGAFVSGSLPPSRSLYQLSRDAANDDSCVSVADRAFPTPVAPPLPRPVSFRSPAFSSPGLGLAGLTLPQIERLAFLETLVACNGCRRLAARKLGVSEKTMYNKIKQYKLAAELENLAKLDAKTSTDR